MSNGLNVFWKCWEKEIFTVLTLNRIICCIQDGKGFFHLTLDPADISNYYRHHISFFLSKFLEHTIHIQVSLYLTQDDLQDPNQSGFKAGHSTEPALLATTAKSPAVRSFLLLNHLSPSFSTFDIVNSI